MCFEGDICITLYPFSTEEQTNIDKANIRALNVWTSQLKNGSSDGLLQEASFTHKTKACFLFPSGSSEQQHTKDPETQLEERGIYSSKSRINQRSSKTSTIAFSPGGAWRWYHSVFQWLVIILSILCVRVEQALDRCSITKSNKRSVCPYNRGNNSRRLHQNTTENEWNTNVCEVTLETSSNKSPRAPVKGGIIMKPGVSEEEPEPEPDQLVGVPPSQEIKFPALRGSWRREFPSGSRELNSENRDD